MALTNTASTPLEIGNALARCRRLFFIGIGGIHMSALAIIAKERGFTVAGSDAAESENTATLRTAGIPVLHGHAPEHVIGFDAVIYTLALTADNPEYCTAKRLGLPLFSRADFLGYLLTGYRHRIGVAGSHGKSTTTAMLGEIFSTAGVSPSVICGARIRRLASSFTVGSGPHCIYEACEYGNSFLRLPPTLAVILNTDLDHVDFFKNRDMLLTSFAQFAATADTVLLPHGDTALKELLKSSRAHYTFGTAKEADYSAADIQLQNGVARFTLLLRGAPAGHLTLRVPGLHNLNNALAAAGAAHLLGISGASITAGLAAFRGIARRMEYRGLLCGARVFDDYAHHPTEITASLTAARALCGNGRLFVLFQSHTYSRTAAFFNEIAAALRAADRVLLTSVYPARETNTLGVSEEALATAIGKHATFLPDLEKAAALLLAELAPNDLLVVMGAGDVSRIFTHFSKKHFTT